MRAFVSLVIRRRVWVLAVIVLLTGLGGLSLSQAVVGTSLGDMFLGEDPKFARFKEVSKRFGSDEVVAVALHDEALLSPASTARLREAVAAVESVSGVLRVRSLLDAVYLEPGAFAPQPVSYADAAARDPSQREALVERLAQDPLMGRLLIGTDRLATAVLVELDPKQTAEAENIPRIVREVNAPFLLTYPPEDVHPAGTPVVVAEVLHQAIRALTLTTPLVAVVLLFTVWLLFGRLWPAAVSLLVATLAAVWTLGVAVQLDRNLNVMTTFVPAVILVIAFSDVVHLCSAYLIELGYLEVDPEAGVTPAQKLEAIVASASEVGRACLFTSITTFVGFVTLSLIPVPIFRVLGVVLGLGVATALLLAVTLVPVLFSYLPAPPPLRTKGEATGWTEPVQRVLDGFLARCQRWSIERPRTVCAGFLIATAIAIGGASQLTIETDFTARLTPNNSVRQDQEWFLDHFLGADAIQVYLHLPSAQVLDDPAWLKRFAEYRDAVEALPTVEGTGSLLNVLETLDRALPGASEHAQSLATADTTRLQGLTRVLRLAPAETLRALVDDEQARTRLLVYPRGTGMREVSGIAAEVEALGAEHFGEPPSGETLPALTERPRATRVEATGLLALLGDFIDSVVLAQRDGLLFSCLVIALLMVIGLRSLRVGLASMLPNLFPLAVLGGCLGAFWDKVDSDAITLSFLALGIGVDDTIHFLSRYRSEVAKDVPTEIAVARTFGFAGRGILMTTLILALGFTPFLLSDYYYMRLLGSLLPLCLIVALLADLLWIPAMARLGWIRFEPPEASAQALPSATAPGPQEDSA